MLTSTIEKVTVYPQGAEVLRTCPLPPKNSLVKLTGLPLNLADGSVQVRIRNGSDSLVARDFKIGLETLGEDQEMDLSERVQEALLAKERLRVQLESVRRLASALAESPSVSRPRGGKGQPPPPQQLSVHLKFLDFQNSQLESLAERARGLELELEAATETLDQLHQQEQSQAREIRPEELRKSATIALSECPEVSSAELLLSYRVRAARWAPSYSVRFSEGMEGAELSMRAIVAQATDEDWSQVELELSTADPVEWRELPELKSLRIGRRESPPPRSWRPPPLGTDQLYSFYDLAQVRVEPTPRKPKPAPAPPPPPPPAAAPMPCEAGAMLDDSWICEEEGGAEFAAAPVLSAAPMSQTLFSRAAGGGGAQPKSLRKRRKVETGSLRQEAPTVTALVMNQRFMEYSSLRMMAATDSRRGELVWREQKTLYQEHLEFSAPLIIAAVAGASRREARLMDKALPPGHHPPKTLRGFDSLFQAQGRVDVPASGQFHSLPITSAQLKPIIRYLTVPRQEASVFRSAELTNASEQGLPQGPVDIFLEGDFLHTTQLEAVGPGGKFKLGLGVTESIKVTRRSDFKETTSGLMGGTASLPHTVVVEAISHLGHPVTLEIHERLPESDPAHKDDIKVELGKVEPGWEKFQPDYDPALKTGHRWMLKLEPGKKREARASYTISFSSKYEIQGGNRREPTS